MASVKIRSDIRPLKVLICGNSGTGKSCLLVRFVDDKFSTSYISTIGLDFKVKELEIDGYRVRMSIWDAAGQERFRSIVASYYRGAQALMLVFDVTDEDSFLSVRNWIRQIEAHVDRELPRVLVGNKTDLDAERVVSAERGLQLAREFGIDYLETSAKNGQGVHDAFFALARKGLIISASSATQIDSSRRNPTPLIKPTRSHDDDDNKSDDKCIKTCNK
jgi:Ras-related protein Rab-8A